MSQREMIGTVRWLYGLGQMGSDDRAGIDDAWWEALGPPVLHPIRVQIIETLRWIGEPLHLLDLREIIDGVVWVVLEHHLRHLKALGAVALVDRPSRLHLIARYRLVVEQSDEV